MTFKNLFGTILLSSLFLTLGAGCSGGTSTPSSAEKITLNVWRVFDDASTFKQIIDDYEGLHPNVNIVYKKVAFEDYESEILKALAKGEGPDIMSVHNTKMGEFRSYLAPLPSKYTVDKLELRGTLRKETVLVPSEITAPTVKTIKTDFVDAVAGDIIWPYSADNKTDPVDRIFGLPLSLDTLALFFNKDLLNAAGIAEPPVDWESFQKAVIALTKYSEEGKVEQSGTALGTGNNVERAADIVQLLMLQNGTQMIDSQGKVAFNAIPDGTPENVYPALDALRFYTDFANQNKETYTWDSTSPTSFEAFTSGFTAMMFGYSYHYDLIRAANPKLNFDVAKIPQIAGGRKVNFANYWIEGVSKTSKHQNYAWDFLLFAANKDHVQSYLDSSLKPTALRALINTQLEDDVLGPFVEQVLTADSWYRGKDYDTVEDIFLKLITTAATAGLDDAKRALGQSARAVAQTY